MTVQLINDNCLHHLLKCTCFATASVFKLPPPFPSYLFSTQTALHMPSIGVYSCHDYKEMHFFTQADESYKRRIALASYPGSGNTWLCLTLEEATGVFTGSVYSDKSLR